MLMELALRAVPHLVRDRHPGVEGPVSEFLVFHLLCAAIILCLSALKSFPGSAGECKILIWRAEASVLSARSPLFDG
jgi:hypothetical protein